MDPAAFRRDRRLRTSGYHLVTWSLAAFVLEARALAGHEGRPGSEAILIVLVAGGLLTSFTSERRVAKMVGPAGEQARGGAGLLWALVLSVLVAASVALAAASMTRWLFPLWMLGVGCGFAIWGRRAAFGWYVGLGIAMAGAAVLDVALAVTGGPLAPVRLAILGIGLPAAGLVTNRRYLWFRPGPAR